MNKSASMVAYIFPFALFLVLTSLIGLESFKPYYPWLYTAMIVLVGGSWWLFRGNFPRPRGDGLGLGIAYGVIGVFLWIGVCKLNLESVLGSWAPQSRGAYNPFEALSSPLGQWSFLAIRFVGLALIVPLVEEVFWRGFLLRWFVDEDFESVPMGTYSQLGFAAVTLLFALAHPEIVAAIVWGAGINLLLYVTKNLWATIAAHMVTNLLLGIYIVKTGDWLLW